MAGKPEIIESKLKKLFEEQAETLGFYNDAEIATKRWQEITLSKKRTRPFSRERIRQLREDFIARGLIPDLDTPKRKVTTKTRQVELTPDIVLEKMEEALEALRERPHLLKELDKYKRGYDNLLETMRLQAQEEKRRKGHEQRFKLAQQQGEIGVTK